MKTTESRIYSKNLIKLFVQVQNSAAGQEKKKNLVSVGLNTVIRVTLKGRGFRLEEKIQQTKKQSLMLTDSRESGEML